MHSPDVQIRQVNPADLRGYWNIVKAGLEEAARYSGGEWIPEDAYAAITRGEMSLYFCTVDSRYAGSLLMMKRQNWNGPALHIFSMYAVPEYGRAIEDHMHIVDEIALQHGCKRITFQSPRNGWKRLAAKHGFSPKTVIFEKEVAL